MSDLKGFLITETLSLLETDKLIFIVVADCVPDIVRNDYDIRQNV